MTRWLAGWMALAMLGSATLAQAASLPQTCADIRAANAAADDGDYTIYPGGMVTAIFCKDMATAPKEYLTLTYTGGSFNYSEFALGSDRARRHFTRVRFLPDVLGLDVTDQTYSTTSGSSGWGYPAQFGAASG